MKIQTISLQLDNGETATFIIAGDGPQICYIMGPGSFYLKGLSGELSGKDSSELGKNITFVACDGLWARNKSDPLPDAKTISNITLESVLQRERSVIKAIKLHFKCKQIALFGFSAPAALAFKYALDYPEDSELGTAAALWKRHQEKVIKPLERKVKGGTNLQSSEQTAVGGTSKTHLDAVAAMFTPSVVPVGEKKEVEAKAVQGVANSTSTIVETGPRTSKS